MLTACFSSCKEFCSFLLLLGNVLGIIIDINEIPFDSQGRHAGGMKLDRDHS